MQKNKDKYNDFKELSENKVDNYTIKCIDRGSNITVIAPHSGKIKDKTTEIAKLIASDYFNYYSFIGQKHSKNRHLHITSTNFDEPKALDLIKKSKIVISIHGCKDIQNGKDYKKHIFIGGLDKNLKAKLKKELINIGLSVGEEIFSGTKPNNICNKGKTKQGVQFELTKSFRDNSQYCEKFISVVRVI